MARQVARRKPQVQATATPPSLAAMSRAQPRWSRRAPLLQPIPATAGPLRTALTSPQGQPPWPVAPTLRRARATTTHRPRASRTTAARRVSHLAQCSLHRRAIPGQPPPAETTTPRMSPWHLVPQAAPVRGMATPPPPAARTTTRPTPPWPPARRSAPLRATVMSRSLVPPTTALPQQFKHAWVPPPIQATTGRQPSARP
jgi:hypothetical protein